MGSSGSRRKVTTQEVELEEQQILCDNLLRRHVAHSRQRKHLVRLAGRKQGRGELKRVRRHDVVVGKSVDEHERPGEPIGLEDQARRNSVRVIARQYRNVTVYYGSG